MHTKNTKKILGLYATIALTLLHFVTSSVFAINQLVSSTSGGVGGNLASGLPSISASERYIAFHSRANNLVLGDTNGREDIFVKDLVTNNIVRASVSSSSQEGNSMSTNAKISNDGRYVFFQSSASNLVANDTNGQQDIFVRDLVNNTTELITVGAGGTPANGQSVLGDISNDGRYVVFSTSASNITTTPNPTNNVGTNKIIMYDRLNDIYIPISITLSGLRGANLEYLPVVSDNGRFVVWASTSSGMVADDTPPFTTDIFLRDTVNNTTRRINTDSNGVISRNGQPEPSWGDVVNLQPYRGISVNNQWSTDIPYDISADGNFVVFSSFAVNLVANDTNNTGDVFIKNLSNDTTTRISTSSTNIQSNGPSTNPRISSNGQMVLFKSLASNLIANDANNMRDIYIKNAVGGSISRVSTQDNGLEIPFNASNTDQLGDITIGTNGAIWSFSSSYRLSPSATAQQDVYMGTGSRSSGSIASGSTATGGTCTQNRTCPSGYTLTGDTNGNGIPNCAGSGVVATNVAVNGNFQCAGTASAACVQLLTCGCDTSTNFDCDTLNTNLAYRQVTGFPQTPTFQCQDVFGDTNADHNIRYYEISNNLDIEATDANSCPGCTTTETPIVCDLNDPLMAGVCYIPGGYGTVMHVTNGFVGIATETPSYPLDVDGTIRAGGVFTLSDARFKTSIEKIDSALEKIRAINGYSFTWKESGQPDLGLLAQEVEKVFADAVRTDIDGKKAVQYNALIAPIIEAIRELNEQIDALYNEKYDAQLQRIEAIEQAIK